MRIIEELTQEVFKHDSDFLHDLIYEWHVINANFLDYHEQKDFEGVFLNILTREIHKKLPNYRRCFDGEYPSGTEVDGIIVRDKDFCVLEYENSRQGLCDNFMKIYRLRKLLNKEFESLFVTKVTTRHEESPSTFDSFNKYVDAIKPILDTLIPNWKILEIVDLSGSERKRCLRWRPQKPGSVFCNMPEKNLMDLLKLEFRHVGDFFLQGEKIQFSLTNYKSDRGSYAFVVDQNVRYVGVTKNTLYARMNGYKNPGPSQETNKRINPKIAEAGKVQIYFLPEFEIAKFVAIIRRKEIEKQIPTDMSIFERFLISVFKPEWNRE